MNFTGTSIKTRQLDQYSSTEEQIEFHKFQALNNLAACNLPPCPRCAADPSEFNRHELRKRQFYVIVEQFVKIVFGLLIRWKCPHCKKTFTDYPDFAVPYKRYTIPTILAFSCRYTEYEHMTYRQITAETHVGYPEKESRLVHTTVYRWIKSIGSYCDIIRNAQDLILQADPSSNICRSLANLPIPGKKYRSMERFRQLFKCRQFLKLEELYRVMFGASIFPILAANCRYQ